MNRRYSMPICIMLAASCQPAEENIRAAEATSGPQQILELGRKGEKDPILVAELRKRKRDEVEAYSDAAQMVLAKLGEKQELDEILNEAKSPDPGIRSSAIRKLKYVANKSAIRALAAQLADGTGFRSNSLKGADGKIYQGDGIFPPPSHQAMDALSEIVSDPPRYNKGFPGEADVRIWRNWWKVNGKRYE